MIGRTGRVIFPFRHKRFEMNRIHREKAVLLQVEDVAVQRLLMDVFIRSVVAVDVLVIRENMGRP